jgi:hypothetical protein
MMVKTGENYVSYSCGSPCPSFVLSLRVKGVRDECQRPMSKDAACIQDSMCNSQHY